jgi:23S rRNA (cytosine1962-C5)-methyltransferase
LPVRGEGAPDRLWARELGVEYAARLGDGLSTGIFLDQRNGRRWLREAARDKSVLNLFAYHAGFTVAAIAGGARRTVSVDASGAALDGARINLRHALGSAELGDRHQLVKADAIAWLAAGGERFDVVVLDPPSFATTHRSTLHVERDYRRLAASAMRRVAPGGTLLACTNLRRMSAELFRRELAAAAREVGREIARMKTMPPPLDFPPPPGEPWHLKSERIELS